MALYFYSFLNLPIKKPQALWASLKAKRSIRVAPDSYKSQIEALRGRKCLSNLDSASNELIELKLVADVASLWSMNCKETVKALY